MRCTSPRAWIYIQCRRSTRYPNESNRWCHRWRACHERFIGSDDRIYHSTFKRSNLGRFFTFSLKLIKNERRKHERSDLNRGSRNPKVRKYWRFLICHYSCKWFYTTTGHRKKVSNKIDDRIITPMTDEKTKKIFFRVTLHYYRLGSKKARWHRAAEKRVRLYSMVDKLYSRMKNPSVNLCRKRHGSDKLSDFVACPMSR